MSSKTRMLGAGRAGSTAYGSNVNMIQFGDRLQGLAPQATHFFISGNGQAGWHNYQTRTNAPKRNYVFCMNQLGGVGRGKSQFKIDGVNNPDGSKTCNPYPYNSKEAFNEKDEYHKTLSGMESSSYPISSSSSPSTVTFELNTFTGNNTSDKYLNDFLLPAMCNDSNVTNQNCLPDDSCIHPCNPTDYITQMILQVKNENTSTDITLFKYDPDTNELIKYLPGLQPTLTLNDISHRTKFYLITTILPGDSNENPITTPISINLRQIKQEFYLEGIAIPEEDFGLTSYLALFAGLFNKVILRTIDNDTSPDKPHVSNGLDGCPNSLCLEYPLEVKILGANSNYDSE